MTTTNTPDLHIGDSAFESWYSTYSPVHKSDKQRARDAYAAGMGNPLVTAAPAAVEGLDDYTPLLDDEGRMMVGTSHHYTAENIRALVAEYKALEAGGPDTWEIHYNTDHRARAGVLWRVISALADEVPFAAAPTTHPEPQQEVQEPVAWLHKNRLGGVRAFTDEPPPSLKAECQELYTAPQPSPASQGDALDAFENKERGILHAPHAVLLNGLTAEETASTASCLGLTARPAGAQQPAIMPKGESAAAQLRAMATNYPAGHLWDKLDAKVCIHGALEIEALRASHGQAPAQAVAGPLNELEELNLLNKLVALGAKAAHAHAQSNSNDGHKGTAAYVQWQEMRAEMGELIRSAYAAPTTQQAPQQEAQEPHGWLYEWTHSSATGKPDATYTAFTTDEAHASKHDNCRAVYTAPQPLPVAQEDALDAAQRTNHAD